MTLITIDEDELSKHYSCAFIQFKPELENDIAIFFF